MRHLICIALGALLFTGCAKEEEEPKFEPKDSLFTAEDLAKGNTNTLPAKEVEHYINYSSDLQASGGFALTQDDDCFDTKMNAVKISADEVNLSMDEEIDMSDCVKEEFAGATTVDAKVKIRMWLGCTEGDMASYDGKTIGELTENEDPCETEDSFEVLMNVEMLLNVAGTMEFGEGESAQVEMANRSLSAIQTADGDPCVADAGSSVWNWGNSCRVYSKDVNTSMKINGQASSSEGVEDYMALTYTDIVEDEDDTKPWYVSGAFGVVLNNWTGTVTYAGATTPPTWSMTDGFVTKSGTVGVNSNTTNLTGQDSDWNTFGKVATSAIQRKLSATFGR